MAITRLINGVWTDVDFTGTRLINGVWVKGQAAAVSAAITGTATASITESDIVTGGKTIIITLTGDTWIAAGTGPIGTTAQSLAICQSLDSAQAETFGWDNEVKANFVATDIARTSATVATITIGAESGYDITAQETITMGDIANAVLTTSGVDVTPTSNTFTIDLVAGFQAQWARNANTIIQQVVR